MDLAACLRALALCGARALAGARRRTCDRRPGAGSQTTNNVTLPGTGSQSATDLLSGRFPSQAYGTNPLVVATDSGKLTDSKYSKAIKQSVSALKKTPHVTAAVSPLSDAGSNALSGQEDRLHIGGARRRPGSITEDEGNAVLDAADPAKKAGLQVAVGGYVGQELSKPDTGASDKIGIAAAMVILLLVFGSAVAAGLPILTAVLGLLCGLSVVTLLSHIADIPTTAPTLATMIGLAVGIDYSLFIVTKHRAQVAEGMEVTSRLRVRSRPRAARSCSRAAPLRSLPALVVAGSRWSRPWATRRRSRWRSPSLGAHPAAGPVRAARNARLGAQAAVPQGSRRRGAVPTVDEAGHGDRQSPLAGDRRCAGDPARALDTHAVDAPGPGGRGGGADRHDRSPGLRPDHEGLRGGHQRAVPDLHPAQWPPKPNQKNLNTISQNEKQLQQQQQQIEQQAELEGATQQQAQQEAKQQTQKQSNELANKKKKAEQPATDPRLQTLRKDLQKTKGKS